MSHNLQKWFHSVSMRPFLSCLGLSLIFLLLLGGCSTRTEVTVPHTPDQQKSKIEKHIHKTDLQKNLERPFSPKKHADLTSQAIEIGDLENIQLQSLISPEKTIAVMLPFSSPAYKKLARELLDAITLALFDTPKKPGHQDRFIIKTIDTGKSEGDFVKALDKLPDIGAEVVIGPLLTQNAAALLRHASRFSSMRFLCLTANPELLRYDVPQNVWFIPSSPIIEAHTLQKTTHDHAFAMLLPPTLSEDKTTMAILNKKTTASIELISLNNLASLPDGSYIYIPLKFNLDTVMPQLADHHLFFGLNWLNMDHHLPPTAQPSFQLVPRTPLNRDVNHEFQSLLNRAPRAIDLVAYGSMQLALQLIEQPDSLEATLAYSSILGTIYLTPDGLVSYDFKLQPLNHS